MSKSFLEPIPSNIAAALYAAGWRNIRRPLLGKPRLGYSFQASKSNAAESGANLSLRIDLWLTIKGAHFVLGDFSITVGGADLYREGQERMVLLWPYEFLEHMGLCLAKPDRDLLFPSPLVYVISRSKDVQSFFELYDSTAQWLGCIELFTPDGKAS